MGERYETITIPDPYVPPGPRVAPQTPREAIKVLKEVYSDISFGVTNGDFPWITMVKYSLPSLIPERGQISGVKLVCGRCGTDSFEPLPVNLHSLTAFAKGFVEIHRKCPEKIE